MISRRTDPIQVFLLLRNLRALWAFSFCVFCGVTLVATDVSRWRAPSSFVRRLPAAATRP